MSIMSIMMKKMMIIGTLLMIILTLKSRLALDGFRNGMIKH